MTSGDAPLSLTESPGRVLDQGDVFLEVPVLGSVGTPVQHAFADESGPAILLTHGCMLDKPSSDGTRPRIEYLQFSRIRTVVDLSSERQALLRRNDPTPYEVLYLGELPGIGECYTSFLETYHVAASFFDLHFVAELEGRSAACGANDTRIASLGAPQRALLTKKLPAFWTRQVPD
ncbi:hypothetical protein OEB99_01515 [Actinotalea sp. M2MS4P-6]|uniref:hypothetical protein n=1 Tax=Actinotalea sp. M2MS4P-6 TaxID=2983762 RepID=UPI0021E4A557|nr:hypothetical protein [Actinotalea sp. M2MS4P-6]MCV2392975.1 hypothetical protein [Actinotalea sp. M2MS4P-6]